MKKVNQKKSTAPALDHPLMISNAQQKNSPAWAGSDSFCCETHSSIKWVPICGLKAGKDREDAIRVGHGYFHESLSKSCIQLINSSTFKLPKETSEQ